MNNKFGAFWIQAGPNSSNFGGFQQKAPNLLTLDTTTRDGLKEQIDVFFIFGLFKRRFSQIDPLKTYFRYGPFEGRQTRRHPYWTKGCQLVWYPSLHVRTGQNIRVSLIFVPYLNWRVSLTLAPLFCTRFMLFNVFIWLKIIIYISPKVMPIFLYRKIGINFGVI
jgi:hypothetical protein